MRNYASTPEDEAHYTALALNSARKRTPKSNEQPAKQTAASSVKAFAGMSTAQILAGLTASQSASLAAALGASPAKAGTSNREPDAEYQRGVANGRAAERTRIGRVYDQAKVQGGDAAALRMLATTDLDSAAITAKLFGAGKAADWADIHAEVVKERGL